MANRSISPTGLGYFAQASDLGNARSPGCSTYEAATQEYLLHSAGAGLVDEADECHYLWRQLRGDCILQALTELPPSAETAGTVGLMLRASLDPRSPSLSVVRLADGTAAILVRRLSGGAVETIPLTACNADMFQLARRGVETVVSAARFGDLFASRVCPEVAFGAEAYFGLVVARGRARFRNVRLIRPAPADFRPYHDYIGSELELLDSATGHRTVVHHEDDSLQAPNWTPDGRALICNRNGRLYRFDLATRTMALIDTGDQVKNNNDHAISFDGTMLGISSGDVSRVYTVPIGGGQPRLLTPEGPSYFHSWSPDGQHLIFTAARGGCGPLMSLYRVPVTGGPEERLTNTPGALDDGSEYSPDGCWIYFNSTRTGRMQLWRMRPDGTGQEQLTFDDTNNWFPHVTPDNRSLVFITYGPEIKAEEHPFYKHVYFRTLPLDGGTPRVIAYVYGGQGSMNVNSWAPDSRRFAFVSNSAAL
jgi:hypothetical protein